MSSKLNVYTIYSLMQDNQIQFSYKGPITQEVLITLGDTIKEKLNNEDCDTKVVRRIFSVLVETAHNILKYSSEKVYLDETNKATGIGLIGIGKTEPNMFIVFSGNIVSSAEAKAIEERLLYINNLSREELHKSYQQQLKQGTITADGSAGLGLYEVARQSERPMEYSFSPLEDGNVFFELKIYVKVEA
ncbi:MAG TPA: SiaB family protein kinase [Candidatus Cloacimonas sp.]|nr:SiaB family protein kinase [Candidatus Cloacimonas sp.]HNS84049.1 SiaB family protein kinase [Candidatus Cloacimonas sp.]